jgi:hypothetical protein
VLINRTHTFTDLICTVDSFEDRLLGAIDGKRTLAEILQLAQTNERRALEFFERLWRYDQVVFETSHAAVVPWDNETSRVRQTNGIANKPDIKIIERNS